MRPVAIALWAAVLLGFSPVAGAQRPTPPAPQSNTSQDAVSKNDLDAGTELQKALSNAGNDSAALVRNLKDYLQRFPDAPRRAGIDRALVESCEQLRDNACALEYAERLIAVQPDDSEMMMVTINLLRQQADDASLARAGGYISRVLDRVEKAAASEKPARESLAEWRAGQDQFRAALYALRGQVEKSRGNSDQAVKDFQMSYSIRPSPLAAELLGEIAELQRDSSKTIEEYTLAFVLPENGPAGKVDRWEVRRKLGNAWRQVHGSEQGLGEEILAAYDRLTSPPTDAAPAARNKDAHEPFVFVLRRLDGAPVPLAPFKGKIVVLSFWATWCGPCRELEPMFDRVAKEYTANPDVTFFAVDTDDDQTLVPPFVAREKWDVPVLYADGLDGFMKVDSLPTVLVLDRVGKIAYRAGGFIPEGFPESLTAAIQEVLAAPR